MGKILIYAMQEGLGGVEQYVLNLSRYGSSPDSKYGYIILGEKTIYESDLKECGVDYFFVTHKNKNVRKNIHELSTLLKAQRKNYDAIYFNTSGLYYPIPYIFAFLNGYKIILHSHSVSGSLPKRLIHYLNRAWILKIATLRLACSTPAGRWMFGKKKFELIPNAINIRKFRFDENNRNECKRRFNLSDRFVIGHIGRFTGLKNQSFLLDVFEMYHKSHKNSSLMLIGDGEDREMIYSKVKDKGLLDDVIFVGQTNEPEYYLSVMDCFVMPSITEGFPITLVEAQANGLPCVVSDVITHEVNISGHIKFVSLGQDLKVWSESIEQNCSRYDCEDKLIDNGFDINTLEERVYKLIKNQSEVHMYE